MRKKKFNARRFTIKLLLCTIYMIVITILVVCAYRMFLKNKQITPWDKVKTEDEYTYITITRMSEKFAYYENEDIGLHFVISEENTGEWHTYVIAIDEKEYDKYKDIVDYSYERIDKEPKPITVYGYPSVMTDELKPMILNNINKFLPAENEIEITNENLEKYLTNSYLDTTIKQNDKFDIVLFSTLLLLSIMIVLFIFTVFDRDKIVSNLDEQAEKVKKKKDKKREIK